MARAQAYLADVARRLAPYGARAQSRHRAQAYLQGVLSEAERTHRGPVADVCGESPPEGFQDLLSRANWDAEAGREARRRDVLQQLADPTGVLVRDESGVLNTGAHAAGVARPDRGTAGTGAHGQSGVVLGSALLARERYRLTGWPEERTRGRQAGMPADRPFAPQPLRPRAVGHRRQCVGERPAAAEMAGGPAAALRPRRVGPGLGGAGLAAAPREHDPGQPACGGVDAPQGGGRDHGVALVGLALAAPGRAAGARRAPLVAGPAQSQHPHGATRLRGV